jgi:hypothetical protein
MTAKKHFILFAISFILWTLIFILGYRWNYFQEWKTEEKIIISVVVFFAILPFVGSLVIIFLKGNYVKTGWWLAFYTSVPVVFLDFVAVGLLQGQGLHYLKTHWYLTIAYFYVWINLPLIGLALQKFREKE